MTEQAEAFDPVQESHMTLMEHLIELRTRLIWVAGALLIGTLIAMIFVNPILRFITEPLTELGADTIAIGPTDTITIFFKVSITVGAVFAMPVIVYQFIAFVAPGLYPHERRMLLLILPGIMVLFLTGAAFAYFVLMPVAVGFLQGFLGDVIRQEWTIDRYIGFVTRVVFWIGVAFEMPLVLAFLARAGIVSGRQLLGFWRQAVVIIAVVAAAITPTVDPINMAIVMGPLLVLYLGSCVLAHVVYRPREPRDFSDGFLPDDDTDDDDRHDGGDDDPPAGPSGSGGQNEPDTPDDDESDQEVEGSPTVADDGDRRQEDSAGIDSDPGEEEAVADPVASAGATAVGASTGDDVAAADGTEPARADEPTPASSAATDETAVVEAGNRADLHDDKTPDVGPSENGNRRTADEQPVSESISPDSAGQASSGDGTADETAEAGAQQSREEGRP